MRKLSSSGFNCEYNSAGACRAILNFSRMLRLQSKIRPTLTGASDCPKVTIGRCSVPSNTRKFSRSRPRTLCPKVSRTVTGTSAMFTSTRIEAGLDVVWVGRRYVCLSSESGPLSSAATPDTAFVRTKQRDKSRVRIVLDLFLFASHAGRSVSVFRSGCGALTMLHQAWRRCAGGCRQPLQSVEVFTIVPLLFDGGFEYERLAAQLGMPEHAAK